MTRAVLLMCAVVMSACANRGAGSAGSDAPYDMVLLGGRIVDGSGNPWYHGDLAIRGNRIARITRAGLLNNARTRQRIDVRGLVVSPGFIDIQSHSWDALLFGDGRSVGKVTQGVTTEILGEATTPAPSNDNMLAREGITPKDSVPYRLRMGFRGPHGFGAWLSALDAHKNSVNSGSYLGAATVRIYTKGQQAGAPSAAELDTMRTVVRNAMEDGAFGISSALIYPPGSYAGTSELVEMAKAMAPYRGSYITHMRSEDDSLFEAMYEAFRIAKEGGVALDIYHLKAAITRNHAKAPRMVALIDSARRSGLDVGATMYTYNASGNNLSACIPTWASENGKLLANLQDVTNRPRILREMTDTSGTATALCQADPPSVIMVTGLKSARYTKYEGQRLDTIALAEKKPWAETLLEIVLEEKDGAGKVTFSMLAENVAMQLRQPWVVIGSDAGGYDPDSARGMVHPRAYGTFARWLGFYTREQGVATLEEAVRRATWATATRLGLTDRGLLAPGFMADITVFDAATIRDNATFSKPHQLSTGVRQVFVNGVQVLRDGVHTGATPGRVLRGPGYRLQRSPAN